VPPAKAKVGLVSLGCPKNLVDSEVMLGRLRLQGHELVADPSEADVIVVNTCAFIDRAKQESIDAVLEMAEVKKRKGARLVVTGCLVQRYNAELRREIPEIDATLGTDQVEQIGGAVLGPTSLTAEQAPRWIYDHTSPRVLSTPRHMAYVKISEGCDYTCSFCIIPKLRGRHRSRTQDDVVAEARALAAQGVRELVLVGQDTTRYGLDLGRENALAGLLRALGAVDGIRWIRVMYAYPSTLSEAVLRAIAEEAKVVKYVDIPLQHASDRILRAMRRPFGRKHLIGLVERARALVPGIALRTSFIVGFPGESREDFEVLLAFVREAEFDNLGVFTYSDEEGTAAFGRQGQVPARVKESRRRRLMETQQRIALRKNRARVGQRLEVLVEGPHPETDLLLSGRHAGQAPDIDGSFLVTDGTAPAGSFVLCEVTEAHPYDLAGRLVAPGAGSQAAGRSVDHGRSNPLGAGGASGL
jgi:ribosomal protein S12 methylthiotransferase